MKDVKLYEVRDIKNLKQMVEESCEIFKDKVAYLVKNDKKEYTDILYSKVLEDVNGLRNSSNKFGTEK